MKYMYALVIGTLLCSSHSFAISGPEIPKPDIKIEQAVALARAALVLDDKIPNWDFAQKKDFILMRADYTDRVDGIRSESWAWEIVFIHPKANDHTIIYKVTNQGVVIHVGYTI